MDNNVSSSKMSSVTDVFISYSSKDEQIANRIVEGLTERGVRCWKAGKYTINSGDDFREKISVALSECKIFLLILSEHSMSTPWVRIELTEALRKNKKIYSLRVDDAAIDELFEFKLGCSQISDGRLNLTPAIENLSINIKKDRDAMIEKEKSELYANVSRYNFFNFGLLNNVFYILFLIYTAVRISIEYYSGQEKDLLVPILTSTVPLLIMTFFYLLIRYSYVVMLKRYADLGCIDAEYLYFKQYFKPFRSPKTRNAALAHLKKAARLGCYPAVKRLQKLSKSRADLYSYSDISVKKPTLGKYIEKLLKSPLSLILNLMLLLLLIFVYFIFSMMII